MLLEKLKKSFREKNKKPEKQPVIVRGFTPRYSKPVTISATKTIRSPARKIAISPRKGSVLKSPRRGSPRRGSALKSPRRRSTLKSPRKK